MQDQVQNYKLMLKDRDTSKLTEESKSRPKRSMAVLRLEKDLQSYAQEKISFVKLTFPHEDNIQLIDVTIRVEEEQSIYKGCQVTFRLTFPDMYPMDAPKIKCLNHIYHPNISYEGSVCLPLVREDYSPTVTLTMIVCGLIFIMTYPNAEDPLNPPIGTLMLKDPTMFAKIVDYTLGGRTFEGKPYDALKFK